MTRAAWSRAARRSGVARRLALAGCAAALAVAGCARVASPAAVTTRPGASASLSAAEVDACADAVRDDPVAYLRRVLEKCAALKQYKVLFTRMERRGLLFKGLQGPERIECWFRRDPFSIRMRWLDEKVKYGESTYVAGQEGDRVRFTPRHGLFGLPPGLTKVDLQTPVIWGEARRPLTAWGMEKLIAETFESMKEMEPRGGAIVDYRGVVTMEETGRAAHYLHLSYPRDPGVASIQELYIDVQTDLPAGTVLRFRNGDLDAAYLYDKLDTHVRLTDDDFVLDIEKRPRS